MEWVSFWLIMFGAVGPVWFFNQKGSRKPLREHATAQGDDGGWGTIGPISTPAGECSGEKPRRSRGQLAAGFLKRMTEKKHTARGFRWSQLEKKKTVGSDALKIFKTRREHSSRKNSCCFRPPPTAGGIKHIKKEKHIQRLHLPGEMGGRKGSSALSPLGQGQPSLPPSPLPHTTCSGPSVATTRGGWP